MFKNLQIEPIELNELDSLKGGADPNYNGCVICNGKCGSGGCFITNGNCGLVSQVASDGNYDVVSSDNR